MISLPIRYYVDEHLHSKVLGVISGACVVFAVSILIALLSYRFYEAPLLKLKRYFSYNRNAASPNQSQTATVS